MQLYHYDRNPPHAFVGMSDAEESPMEPGVYLVPAYSTTAEPMPGRVGWLRVFDRVAEAWAEIPIEQQAESVSPQEQSLAERIRDLRQAVQRHADIVAVSQGFDDIREAVSYADEPAVPSFQARGRALRAWRSVLWAAFEELVAAIQAGKATVPSNDELQAALPQFEAEADGAALAEPSDPSPPASAVGEAA